MMVFQQWWVFLLLPLPLLMQWLLGAYHTPRAALRVSLFRQLVNLTGHRPARGALILKRSVWQQLGLLVAWVSIVTALARPVWLEEPQVRQLPARDLMLAVDLSGSMDTEDFHFDEHVSTDEHISADKHDLSDENGSASSQPLTRLDGVKRVISEFVAQRDGDRLGLIVFGSMPYLQVPFTDDQNLFLTLLGETRTRMAGPKTMLGDAIGLAVKHFSASQDSQSGRPSSKEKVLLLLTDGNDSGSRVPPLEAAQVAADNEIVIHTIAVGDPSAVGEEAMDIDTLQGISALTHGVFFHARSGVQLQQVMEELEKLEPNLKDTISYRPQRELFFWPLGIGLLLQLALQYGLAWSRLRRQVLH